MIPEIEGTYTVLGARTGTLEDDNGKETGHWANIYVMVPFKQGNGNMIVHGFQQAEIPAERVVVEQLRDVDLPADCRFKFDGNARKAKNERGEKMLLNNVAIELLSPPRSASRTAPEPAKKSA